MEYKVSLKTPECVKKDLVLKDCFNLTSKDTKVKVASVVVSNVSIYDDYLKKGPITKKVLYKYNELLRILPNLLIEEDNGGSSVRHALNLIEKFRLEIKNKYRGYLEKEMLKEMSNQLKIMQKIALERELEMNNFIYQDEIGKAK